MVVSVYQWFDDEGKLLYVGITSRGRKRANEHSKDKVWWPLTSGCAVEHYEAREAALKREAWLIAAFKPPYNTQHYSDVAGPRVPSSLDSRGSTLPKTLRTPDYRSINGVAGRQRSHRDAAKKSVLPMSEPVRHGRYYRTIMGHIGRGKSLEDVRRILLENCPESSVNELLADLSLAAEKRNAA